MKIEIDSYEIEIILSMLEGSTNREKIINFIKEYIWKGAPVCEVCGKHKRVGEHQGKKLCQDCWADTLTDEEIKSL